MLKNKEGKEEQLTRFGLCYCYVFNITCMKMHNEIITAELYMISFLNFGSKSPSLYQYTC